MQAILTGEIGSGIMIESLQAFPKPIVSKAMKYIPSEHHARVTAAMRKVVAQAPVVSPKLWYGESLLVVHSDAETSSEEDDDTVWARRLTKRTSIVAMIKKKPEYLNCVERPSTPVVQRDVPKRVWETAIMKWRAGLRGANQAIPAGQGARGSRQ